MGEARDAFPCSIHDGKGMLGAIYGSFLVIDVISDLKLLACGLTWGPCGLESILNVIIPCLGCMGEVRDAFPCSIHDGKGMLGAIFGSFLVI